MGQARVKRGAGPKGHVTEGNYRKKALPFLLQDFEKRCAYCLDPDEFRHPSLNHVEHFNCKLHGRRRHQYGNLMLACAACNLSKHEKPVVNPLDRRQRLLNCTEETEFPEHIEETEDGQWRACTPEGDYHLTCIGLQESCHRNKRRERLKMAKRILSLLTQAVRFETQNPVAVHQEVLGMVRDLLNLLEKFPPLVTERGVVTVRDWLIAQGVTAWLLREKVTPGENPAGGDGRRVGTAGA